ncbi:MAG: GNAT family N-acetyltransferase [Brevundimonas sp.]
MTDFIIRPATPDDALALSVLGRATFIETFVTEFGIPYPPEDLERFLGQTFSEETTRTRLVDPDYRYWAAERDSEILGFANTGRCSLPHPDARAGHAELHRLYVSKAAQGVGVGKGLLKVALEWMEANTDGPLWIGVWSGNLKAQKFYAAHGFEKVGEYQYPVGAWRDDEFILRRG